MKLAFWKRKRSRRDSSELAAAGAQPEFDASADEADAASAAALLRVRTRRRLIGAFALLLAVVVLVPMLLDSTPRAVPDNIPIELPSDKTPFAPRLPAPRPEASGAAEGTAVVPAAPGSAADSAADAPAAGAVTPEPRAAGGAAQNKGVEAAPASGKKRATPPADTEKGEGKHAAHKTDVSAPATARIYVQAAAMASEGAAQELANRLQRSGLTSFVERTETNDGVRFRVRLGPFASRSDAEHSRARLRALGVHSNIVGT